MQTSERKPPLVAMAGEDGPRSRRSLALGILCVSVLMVNLDNTVLNVALPTLARVLHAGLTQLQWIVDCYIVVYAGLVLVAGSLADRLGRKRTFLAGLVIFAAGSAWAAFSGSVGMLIAARAGMGVGGALMMPSTLSIVTGMFGDPSERQRAIALWAGAGAVGGALGPIVGGLLLSRFWWGSVFLINVPIAAAGVAAAIWLVPDSRKAAALRPDLAGAALSVAGLGLLVWAVIEAPLLGWSSGLVIGAGLAAVAILCAFVAWERASPHPMLRLEFFARRRFSAAISSMGLANFGLYGALFLVTQFLQFDLAYTPLQAGLRIVPAAGAVVIVSPAAATVVRLAGTKFTVAAGLLLIAAGLQVDSGLSAASTYGDIVFGMVLLGVGAGLAIPAAIASAMGSLPPGDTGVGSATNGTFMQVGGALGVAVIGSLLATRYQGHMTAALARYRIPHAIHAAILGSIGGALEVAARLGGTLGSQLAHAARSGFISGADLGLRTTAVIALAGGLIALTALPSRAHRQRRPDLGWLRRAARGSLRRNRATGRGTGAPASSPGRSAPRMTADRRSRRPPARPPSRRDRGCRRPSPP
jgi:EmrB/QacA subfamily drug resistance transporter